MIVFITGASAGFGAEMARTFVKHGHQVVISGRRKDRLDALAGELGDLALPLVMDGTDKASIQDALSVLPQSWRAIDVLINNAGIAIIKKIHEHTSEEWDRVMNVNVKTIFWFARHVIPVMQKQGRGVILNTGSISSVVGLSMQGAYGPSKGAVIQLTRRWATE